MSTTDLWGCCEFHEGWSSGSHTLLSGINEFPAILGTFVILCSWNPSKDICTTVLLNICFVKTCTGRDVLIFVNGMKLVQGTSSQTKHKWCMSGSTHSLIQKEFDCCVLRVYIKTHSLEANTTTRQNGIILCRVGRIKILCGGGGPPALNTGSGLFKT